VENPDLKWMRIRGIPISGNHQYNNINNIHRGLTILTIPVNPLPSGKLTYLLKIAIYSGFSH
jgi:hypothetical protein